MKLILSLNFGKYLQSKSSSQVMRWHDERDHGPQRGIHGRQRDSEHENGQKRVPKCEHEHDMRGRGEANRANHPGQVVAGVVDNDAQKRRGHNRAHEEHALLQ